MVEEKTPKWLIDTQNKSWEPEILISGITLTFLFILSNYIFNFFGMMIQELNVRYIVGRNFYVVSIIILNGLKVGLIFHLILRGLWTGFVGLSYVFPEGINIKNLPESKRKFNYYKPEEFVIKLERICSLLFSFIFSSIIFIGSFCLGMIPFALLYILGLDVATIKILILYFILPIYILIGIIWIILATKKKTPKMIEKSENSIFSIILTTYFTNMGKTKTLLTFVLYFILIGSVSWSDISKFDFKNGKGIDVSSNDTVVQLKKDHYLNDRDEKIRISKSAIGQFWVNKKSIELFISLYKEDDYTIKNLKEDPSQFDSPIPDSGHTGFHIGSLYHIYIDSTKISGLKWYLAEQKNTDQKGYISKIPVDSLNPGDHVIRINKVDWIDKKKELKVIGDWDKIPFVMEYAAGKL